MGRWNPQAAVAAGRKARGQYQKDLAELLTKKTGKEWTRDMIANIEAGRKTFGVDTLMAIAEVQDLPIEFYLFGPAGTSTNQAKGGYLGSLIPAMST